MAAVRTPHSPSLRPSQGVSTNAPPGAGRLLLLALVACGCTAAPLPAEDPVEQPKERAPLVEVIVDPPVAQADTRVFELDNIGLSAPESVLYDADSDNYLISNIDGSPFARDNNGFISRFLPDGRIVELKWIAGGQNGVTLNAPKGLAVNAGVLYVADLDTVRAFDLKTGAPKFEISIEGSTFLNDLSVSPESKLYVSDSGVKENFQPSGSAAIYSIDSERKVEKLASGAELGLPNGLLADATGTWVSSFGTGQLYHLGKDGTVSQTQTLPKGQLDGIARWDDKRLLVASWECGCVYGGTPGGEFSEIVRDVSSPADISFDDKHARLLVPQLLKDTLQAHALAQ